MDSTHLRQPLAIPVGFGLATLALGVALGFLGPGVASWLADLLDRSPLPTPGLLQVIADLPMAWSIPIGVLLGVIGGVFLAMSIMSEGLQLSVTSDHLEYHQEGREGWIERSEVAAVYPEGSDVVVLDPDHRIRARLDADGVNRAAIASAMREHGYPWREQDPFEAEYQRWMDGRPGFTAAEHRLIARWQEVRRNQKERAEADAALREANLVVRYTGGRVQVRRAGESDHGTHGRPAAP